MFIFFWLVYNFIMKKFLFVLQVFIKCFLIFLILFIWLRYLFNSLWLSLLIAFAVTLFVELISIFIKKKKGDKTNLKIKEKEEAEMMFFSLSNDTDYMEFFSKLVKSRHSSTLKYKRYIYITHQDNTRVVLYPHLKYQTLNIDDIVSIIGSIKKNIDRLVIVCNDYNKDILNYTYNYDFEIVLLDKYQTYQNLYKEYDFYPIITINKKASKQTFKDFLSMTFNKNKAKGYLISALALLVASFFVRYNLYYNIFATILLIFALFSFVNTSFNKRLPREII